MASRAWLMADGQWRLATGYSRPGQNGSLNPGGSGRPVKEQLKQVTDKTWDRVREGVKIKREAEKRRKAD